MLICLVAYSAHKYNHYNLLKTRFTWDSSGCFNCKPSMVMVKVTTGLENKELYTSYNLTKPVTLIINVQAQVQIVTEGADTAQQWRHFWNFNINFSFINVKCKTRI